MTLIKATVTFNGLTEFEARPNSSMIHNFDADPKDKARAIEFFRQRDLFLTSESDLTISIEGTKSVFEKVFSATLTEIKLKKSKRASEPSIWYPTTEDSWKTPSEIAPFIDEVYIQWPWIYQGQRFANKDHSPFPPRVTQHHLRAPGDIAMTVNAAKVHRAGIMGNGVRVVMLDSGFNFDHHYFQEHGYNVSTILGPGASNKTTDPEGHGTAMAATLLSVAPNATLVGIKLVNDDGDKLNTRLTEGFEEALKHRPQIISISLAADLADDLGSDDSRSHLQKLPGNLKSLEALILKAVARGITVVCAGGNGDVAFPAMMSEVIAVGGAYIDEKGELEVSNYTSAFKSAIYSGRAVPDICGLSGMKKQEGDSGMDGRYMMLPVQRLRKMDREVIDNTHANDSWAIAGGSSTAAAQVAGVCALLLEKDRTIKPSEIKTLLKLTATDINRGTANEESNVGRALVASGGWDSASGAGLVDAYEAFKNL